ncbi:hypothetical protein [Streptomyces sp. GC420]|uniref:hypothetical protein n=1 Tax=Streptomyces sp. GC420 TaxID=2697568 RepID=UPI001414DC88|nr:hypothetical protein [Streptomyces sp. GC420]NBM17654.1 hypothetical protein [Streptomyces sp. GC420]
MAAVAEILESVRRLVPLTGEGVAAEFAAQGWEAGGRPRNGFETSWAKDDVRGWIHPYRGGVRVEFTVWLRDVDEETGCFEDLEAVYGEGERALTGFLPEIESSALAAHLIEAEGTPDDADEFIPCRKWILDDRLLVTGVVQEDTDLPVRVVVAWEERSSASAGALSIGPVPDP